MNGQQHVLHIVGAGALLAMIGQSATDGATGAVIGAARKDGDA